MSAAHLPFLVGAAAATLAAPARASALAGASRIFARGALTVAALAATAAAAFADMSGGLLPVPAETIARGDTITAPKLTEKHFYYDRTRALAVITDPGEVIGKAARRTLRAGKPIPLNSVQPVRLVARGRPTQARFSAGNLVITATVLPQSDAGPGDLVRARNIDSGRTITGIVRADGTIEVSSP
jgi:flagella basal body P-ring formation protein FlgA